MVFSSVTFVFMFLPIFFLGYFSLYGLLCAHLSLAKERVFIVVTLLGILGGCLWLTSLPMYASANDFVLWWIFAGIFSALLCLFLVVKSKVFALNTCILFGSLLFYAWGEPGYVFLLIFSTIINYGFGLLLDPSAEQMQPFCLPRKKAILFWGIAINLLLLIVFKYGNFVVNNGGVLLHAVLPHIPLPNIGQILLPLGISFYTFQGLSYLVDVYRNEVRAARNIVDFGCYLTMFPQLVAGPIVRYASIADQLRTRHISLDDITAGASRFIMGLAKKLLIADTLGRSADVAFSIPAGELSFAGAWIGAICYTLQIYYDFSGYSDMAIGLGRIMGFTFPENFNYPYVAQSVREFWRRWHMTLSGWFRDYLYIPLGGNRAGMYRTLANLLFVFALCGLWHGAAWSFMLWGLWHGLFLIFERIGSQYPLHFPRIVRHVYALTVVVFGWVLFRADSAGHCAEYMKAMLGGSTLGVESNRLWLQFFSGDTYIALLVGLVLACPIYLACLRRIACARGGDVWCEYVGHLGVLLLFVLCTLPLFGATYNAFIYFRF